MHSVPADEYTVHYALWSTDAYKDAPPDILLTHSVRPSPSHPPPIHDMSLQLNILWTLTPHLAQLDSSARALGNILIEKRGYGTTASPKATNV